MYNSHISDALIAFVDFDGIKCIDTKNDGRESIDVRKTGEKGRQTISNTGKLTE